MTSVLLPAHAQTSGNEPPVTMRDSIEIRAGFQESINVLSNDTDPENDELTLLSASSNISGLTIISFTPAGDVVIGASVIPDIYEVDYVVEDSAGNRVNGIIEVTVFGSTLNAIDDSISIETGSGSVYNVLSNDISDGLLPLKLESVKLESVESPNDVSLMFSSDGNVTINVVGPPRTITLSYTISEGAGTSMATMATGNLVVTVTV